MSDALSDTIPPQRGRILRLPFATRETAPDFPTVRAVQTHWESLRDGRIAPARSEIDPRPLAHCLDVMFVAELVAPRVARLRLAGQQLNDLLGMEPRGMPLSVFFAATARDELAEALLQVGQGARALLPLRADARLAQPALDGMLALLPLTDTENRITRILGVLETRGPTGRAPRRFRLTEPMRTQRDSTPARVPVGQKPSLIVIKGGKA
ncbi:PAS domain-containing protein [Pararhodobacter zhoushanensis]|uniref:PAS domain-containing protein n=1 Tax=Pararhodobacter zhoushanensis TaxID=2479545 RepID=UPI000F8E687D|nr:PAS domain-containing protein [Pararhodobacter zhoushanensis]